MIENPSLDRPPSGSIRFNTDSSKLEIYNGEAWWEIDSTSPEFQTGGTRGLVAGGYTPTPSFTQYNTIDFFNASSLGDAIDFGDLTKGTIFDLAGQTSSRTRAIFGGGYQSGQPRQNSIDFVTIASQGDAQDFGDLTRSSNAHSACSNQTRAIYAGGYWPSNNKTNIIDYVTIAQTGNAVDFGDLIQQTRNTGSCASPTRAVWAGGTVDAPSNDRQNVIQFVTISTTGNSADFGDLSSTRNTPYGASNAIRGVFSYGYGPSSPHASNAVEFITIASLGNAQDFGDAIDTNNHKNGVSTATRILWAGSGGSNVIQYKEIMTTGDFIDFGNLTVARGSSATGSNGHGGLF